MDELAEKIGVSRSAIGHWETGRSVPSPDKIPWIIAALRLDDFSYLVDTDVSPDQKTLFPSHKPAGELIPATVVSVMEEAMDMLGKEGDYAGFLIDCIYRRWNELKQEERDRMRQSKDPLDNDEFGGIEEAKEELRKDRDINVDPKKLPNWIQRKMVAEQNKNRPTPPAKELKPDDQS